MSSVTKFLGVIALIALIPVFSAWAGYCYLPLWEWFVEPVFGVSITWRQMAGLMFIVGALVKSHSSKDDSDEPFGEMLFSAIFVGFLFPPLVLLFGWVINIFVVGA